MSTRNERRIILLWSIIACLVISWGVGLSLRIMERQAPVLPDIAFRAAADSVQYLELGTASGVVQLRRQEGIWVLDHPELPLETAPGLVDQTLAFLATLPALRAVTSDEKAAGELGFDGRHTIRLLDSARKVLAEWEVAAGTAVGRSREAYVRHDQAPLVVATDAAVLSLVERSAADWADMRFWPFNDESYVSSFVVSDGAGTERYTRASDGASWSGAGSDTASRATAREILPLLRQILTLEGTRVEVMDHTTLEGLLSRMKPFFVLELHADRPLVVTLYGEAGGRDDEFMAVLSWGKQALDGRAMVLYLPRSAVGDLKIRF